MQEEIYKRLYLYVWKSRELTSRNFESSHVKMCQSDGYVWKDKVHKIHGGSQCLTCVTL